jgi:DNA topoisomerase-2
MSCLLCDITEKILAQITFVWQSLGINVKVNEHYYYIYTSDYYKYTTISVSRELTLPLKYFQMEVTPIGENHFVGWQVDRNERFLLGNFIVTHNSRISNGKDAASPRYIFTEINDITKKIYNSVDENLLHYLEDEGAVIEPEYYVPIIPMVLVNGASGIGTAYSTNIPCYNPKDVIDNMVRYIKKQPLQDLQPWYKNFKGRCIDNVLYGIFKVERNKIHVSELPLTSINDYTEFIESSITEGKLGIKEYLNYSTETSVNIVLIFETEDVVKKILQGDPYRVLKLTKNISTSNMHLFDAQGKIKKYDTPNDILKEFTQLRLQYNLKRKEFLVAQYSSQISLFENKIRFIMGIINEDFVIYKKSKKDIVSILEKHKFEKIQGDYTYLLDMKMTSFSKEKIEELQKKLQNNQQLLLEISKKNEKQILVEDLNNLLN